MVSVRFDSPAAGQDVMAKKAVWRKECEQDSFQSRLNLLVVKPSLFYGKIRLINPYQNAVKRNNLKYLD